jgi:flagellar biosynthetic protein FlhB
MAGDKTEKPTGRRLDEARRKGNVPRSRDLVQIASMAAALGALVYFGPSMVMRMGGVIEEGLLYATRHGVRDIQAREIAILVRQDLAVFALLVAPLLAAAVAAVLVMTTAQGGLVFAAEALNLNWSRLSPAAGFARLGFKQGGIEALKAVFIGSVLVYVAYDDVVALLAKSPALARMSPLHAAAVGWDAVRGLLQTTALLLGFLAVADYGLQRWRVMSGLKMSKDEVKDEAKLSEGNPHIKARVRKVQREMHRSRMLRAAAKATVVITNPTHYAVALEYDRRTMSAPRVVAKGKGFLAQQIKQIARDHEVPMVENVPLAQALYKTAEVGDTIPAELFTAVAEVLSYLIRLKQISLN